MTAASSWILLLAGRLRAWVMAEPAPGHGGPADVQLSALRVMLLACAVLGAGVGMHSAVLALRLGKPWAVVIVLLVLGLLGASIGRARQRSRGGVLLLLAAIYMAGLGITVSTGSQPELSRLGYVVSYMTPMVAGLLLSWRLGLALMLFNSLFFLLAVSGFQAPQLPQQQVRLPGSLFYVHAALFMFFNLCLPLAVFRLVDGMRRTEAQLRGSVRREAWATWHDPLTGLPNRAHCIRRLQACCTGAAPPLALLTLRLCNLRQLNARYGVAAGDELLRHFVRQLRAVLPAGAGAARVRGSVIALLLPLAADSLDEAAVLALVAGLRARLPQHGQAAQQSVALELAFGLVTSADLLARQPGADGAELLRCAELALDMGQDPRWRETHDGLVLLNAATARAVARSMAIEAELPQALAGQQLHLLYQPKLRPDGQLLGFEALVRWTSPVLGAVSPVDFIPVAEACGLVGGISDWVIDAACAQLAQWRTQGLPVERCHLAINLSARDLERDELFAILQAGLARHGVPPAQLELEVTESALARQPTQALQQLQRLHEAGFRIAIDDFGTGYSSLAKLVDLPIDVLKIDRSFLRSLPGDARRERVVRSVVSLAHSLRLQVVAEGVETVPQLLFLQALGVQGLQGYLYGRPERPGHWEALIRQGSLKDLSDTVPAALSPA
ncbi:putative bifunctional diguanylate cyclase/phosphodiesterase [Paucibacter sp. M5-1]|uniref:putative bifunctional diguanylate cyclase/phosphodiesterase n=1 Tax=Paucibacter sp. M5-1 TaxID=3015998 RepID=UPI0022B8D09C|nr:bifunctional diguanylate cyclase/phosphodiesterase [Paucibacter sp. M5-1]MCZ7880980.1 bifunctional diguanylate cyclase/phosphodiesterase [Paucibacter sp. M5-1]